MAKTNPVDSYTIEPTNNVVRVGDCVLMRPFEPGKPSYIGQLESMETDRKNRVKVRVRWYYRPEESLAGRCPFHGSKELFLSDHYDFQYVETIEDKCFVHSLDEYTQLENVGGEDYFSRFEYLAATGGFFPERVVVYCKCEMPYNPDKIMIQCDGCKDWFHPECLEMTSEEGQTLDHFMCSECWADDQIKEESGNSGQRSPLFADTEVASNNPKS